MRVPLVFGRTFLVCLLTWTASSYAGAENKPQGPSRFEQARLAAKTAFLSMAPVEKAVSPEELRALEINEEAGWDSVKRLEEIRSFLSGLALAAEIQQARGAKADFMERRQRLYLAAASLRMDAQETARAEALYLYEKPQAQQGEAALLKEQAALEKMLQNPSVPEGRRASVEARMNAIARVLKGMSREDAGLSVGAKGMGAAAGLTAADFKALNAVRAPGPKTLKTVQVPLPDSLGGTLKYYDEKFQAARSRQLDKQKAVLDEARKVVSEDKTGPKGDGVWDAVAAPNKAKNAYDYWKAENANKNNSWAWRAYAKTNMALLKGSGLIDIEQKVGEFGYVMDNKDVSLGQKSKMFASAAGESALFVVSALPAVGGAGRLAKGEKFLSFGPRAGKAIKGFAAVSDDAANLTAREFASVIKSAGKDAAPRDVLRRFSSYAKKYNLQLVEDRSLLGIGMSEGGLTKIVTNTRMGAKVARHEVTHGTVQQLYLRVACVKDYMLKKGIAGRSLNPAEMAEALKSVPAFETAIPAFEKGALYASKSQSFSQGLLTNLSAFSKGAATGKVPALPGGAGAEVYARMNYLVGFTTTQGLGNIGVATYTGLRSQLE